jgi:predicted CXXCH cytochrome family protein
MRFTMFASAVFVATLATQSSSQAQQRPAAGAPTPASRQTPAQQGATYVGSRACQQCHVDTYERWSKTRMANIVSDPREKPQAIIPDMTKPDPLVTFKVSDIAFTYGSKWKQRYFTKVGNDYFPLPAQWDVQNKVWRPYMVQPNTDWWVPHYPADNMKRPTGPLCDGCHSVNYDVKTKTVTEWNVGCEKCHGPGSLHVQNPSATTIVNPARLDYVRGNDVCIQCHSQGQPLTNPIEGQYYDWPVGFKVGLELKDFWKLEEHKLGETTFMHFADGTAHKNRMQGNDFVSSVMYTRGVTCYSCHDVHGTSHNADLVKPAADVCATCHRANSPAGPHTSTVEEHTHHAAGSAGGQCVACHMPKIAPEIANVNVRAHTFRFITPTMTEEYKMPNACVGCHTDRTNAWASGELRQWSAHSPWRLE